MKNTHKTDHFLLELFQQYQKSNLGLGLLKDDTTEYLTIAPYQPKISIKHEFISMEVDTQGLINQQSDYSKPICLSEKGKHYVSFKLALPELLDQLGLSYEKEYEMARSNIN